MKNTKKIFVVVEDGDIEGVAVFADSAKEAAEIAVTCECDGGADAAAAGRFTEEPEGYADTPWVTLSVEDNDGAVFQCHVFGPFNS